MLNVAEKALQVLENVRQHGFKEIKTHRIIKESKWNEQYAIFIVEFRIPDPIIWQQWSEYTEDAYFDEHKFRDDFADYLRKEFPDCEIERWVYTNEYEIRGPKCDEFFNKYSEQIEEYEQAEEAWGIFIPKNQ